MATKGINAAAWFARQSFAGRIETAQPTEKRIAPVMMLDRWDERTQSWRQIEARYNPATGNYEVAR